MTPPCYAVFSEVLCPLYPAERVMGADGNVQEIRQRELSYNHLSR